MGWYNFGIIGGGTRGGIEFSEAKCYQWALTYDPGHSDAWYGLGVMGGGTVGDTEYNKKECYEQALTCNPENKDAWCSLGVIGGGTVDGTKYSKEECSTKAGEFSELAHNVATSSQHQPASNDGEGGAHAEPAIIMTPPTSVLAPKAKKNRGKRRKKGAAPGKRQCADVDAFSTMASYGPARGAGQKRKRTGHRREEGKHEAEKKTDGWVDLPRPMYRELEGRRSLVDGNVRTCGQDALTNAAKALGVPVTKASVYAATLPAEGDTEVGVLVQHAQKALGIQMLDTKVPATLGASLFQMKGGAEHSLLQCTSGVFFVELVVSMKGKPDDRHAVMLNAGYAHPTAPHICGAIFDNCRDVPVKLLGPEDRCVHIPCHGGPPIYAARAVFDSLFQHEDVVQVKVDGAWLMRRSV